MDAITLAPLAVIAAALALGINDAGAQIAPQRTLEELKAEAQARADRNAYPLIGLKPEEVREALGRLTSLDRDAWAASWSIIGERYRSKAESELPRAPAEADKDFVMAWRYFSFARWPVPNSPGKQRAYEKALAAFIAHGKLQDPPLEVLRVPFEGKEIIAYLQLPRRAGPVPLVLAVSGLDSRKEDMAERFQPMLAHGVASLAVDAPGTGEAPIKVAPGAERMLTRLLDAVLARPEIDKSRVAVYGGSFGGYWSTILAASERARLSAVVAQSPPVDETFSPAMLERALTNTEYLFDYVPAGMSIYPGVETLEQLRAARAETSLKRQGFLDRPMAPMLVIAGVKDTQVPIADIDLLLHSGSTPKDAWINPQGGHMGREATGWTDPAIFKRVTMPWLLRALEAKAE
ncbi:MAG TPA: alpha/beta fold hydrolase [Stellaceae bacterium]|nr:alpha/beta fold hydrolase [Stellaceae bacterium]